MICFPNAKINLGLNIVSQRNDGFHNLETIFYPINLKDGLEITNSNSNEQYQLFQTGIKIDGDPSSNIVIKALELVRNHSKVNIPNIDIHLLKKIPTGAGLGGGSSDAAFMLKLLNENYQIGLSNNELVELALQIGADCPFFLYNKPAFASGIGNQLEPIDLDLSGMYLLVVKPDVFISTKEAYSMITPKTPTLSLKDIVNRPLNEWKELMKNDFEDSIFKKYPQICKIKQQLYELGATYASMSGSGSSLYGIFNKKPNFQKLFSNNFTWLSSPNLNY
ncbi:MAG TPA: 4-(cytidine 5'-diphospho)-2-C-methyl-D-erythritol kinase [Bacteroidales bacterium]|nr:4-(cytidine 5'-diphospho)-2-C-methyl-D-erythritol kinase [Bacteroidales bacterium]